jgi:sn-glycerol 3-phosphate transport system substrate-binding protein
VRSLTSKSGKGSRTALAALALIIGGLGCAPRASAVEISFYYPVAVSGPLTQLIESMAADFEKANPGITVKPVYSGNYGETLTKALTANRSGQPPQVAVLVASDMYTLLDEDAIVAADDLVKTPEQKAWLTGFFPAFMQNGKNNGKTYGIPFQRSTQLLYWNKDAFKKAGLDPEKPPVNWDELVADGKKLTIRDAGGKVTQWGLMVPSGVTSHWFLQGFATPNGATLMNEAGTKTFLDTPEAIEALQFWGDLSQKHAIMPSGVLDTGTTPNDFIAGRTAMLYHSTGNLANIKKNAKFEFGVAMLPAKKHRGSPTGGGSIYIFKKSTPEQLDASLKFVTWMTSAEQAARWSIGTGYVAPRPDAWETPAMKDYAKTFAPALVAREQLQYSVAEFSTHDGSRTTKALEDAIEAVVTGNSPAAAALKKAQADATRLLRPYQH